MTLKNNRYLIDFDSSQMEIQHYDVLIIGSGIAGLYTALMIPENYSVALLSKDSILTSSSMLAQGGIAAALGKDDTTELHFKDTLYTGDGLCDEESVRVLVNEAEENINQLYKLGVKFDTTYDKEIALSREAAHTKNRIVHIKDITGQKICEPLLDKIKQKKNIRIFEETFAIDLLTQDNTCLGAVVINKLNSKYKLFLSNSVVCSSGGIGQVYSNTTNSLISTGDGIAMAYRAGASITDMEFIQFHPTVFFQDKNNRFLISEAVRGEGGLLKNFKGQRFMTKYHELCELAPRDVVSRAIFKEMEETNSKYVFLDITFKGEEFLKNRFPGIFATCLKYGINISKDLIPVSPCAHYCMGGIKTDLDGRTNIKGLFACGEVACTGVHGANRLASNSLLEGLVFGRRVAREIANTAKNRREKLTTKYISNREERQINLSKIKKEIQDIVTECAGIIKSQEGLNYAKNKVEDIYKDIFEMKNTTYEHFEVQNILLVAEFIIKSSLERKESRGAHFREEFPYKDDTNFKKHIIVKP